MPCQLCKAETAFSCQLPGYSKTYYCRSCMHLMTGLTVSDIPAPGLAAVSPGEYIDLPASQALN